MTAFQAAALAKWPHTVTRLLALSADQREADLQNMPQIEAEQIRAALELRLNEIGRRTAERTE